VAEGSTDAYIYNADIIIQLLVYFIVYQHLPNCVIPSHTHTRSLQLAREGQSATVVNQKGGGGRVRIRITRLGLTRRRQRRLGASPGTGLRHPVS